MSNIFIQTNYFKNGLSSLMMLLFASNFVISQQAGDNRVILSDSTTVTDSTIQPVKSIIPQAPETEASVIDPVKVLMERNRRILAAKKAYESALEKVTTKGVLPDPMIENSIFLQPIETKNGPMKNQLMLGQRFPLWGKLNRQKKIAVFQAENAGLVFENEKIRAVFTLNKLRANYAKINRSLEILNQYRAELESFRDVALTQYSTGVGATQHPILKLQIEMGLIESRINLLQSKLKTVESDLQTLFDGQFTPDLFQGVWSFGEAYNQQQWLQLAQELNPQLRMIQNQVAIKSLQQELAIRSNYPDLNAGITYTSIGASGAGGKDALGVKAGINIPLWFKRNKARVEAATLDKKAKEEILKDTWNQIEGDIISIQKEIQELGSTSELYEKSLIKQSEQMIASAYSAYETGKISFLDLLDSERMDVKIRLEYEQVKAELAIANAKMNKTVGKIQ